MVIKKSILFVHYGTGLGGAPKALRYIIEACVKNGYSCSVACLKCPETNLYFRESGADIILLDILPQYSNSTTFSHRTNTKSFLLERAFAKEYEPYWHSILKKYGPFSLVFINSMVLCDLIAPTQIAGYKVIQVIRETAQIGPSLEIMKEIIGKADTILYISEYDYDLFSLDASKCIVIPDAVDPDLYAIDPKERCILRLKNGIEVNEVVLLFTGGAAFIKGGHLLLESLLQVNRKQKITLLYAGYGGNVNINSLKNIAKTFLSVVSLSSRFQNERIYRLLSLLTKKQNITIKNLGFCPNIEEYFKLSDICAIPYVVPHQAMPIFEAGMSGIPCLVSDFSNFRYEVTDGDNGYMIPVSRPDLWASKIEELAVQTEKRKFMGLRNYERAISRHNRTQNNEKIVSLINVIISHDE